MKKIILYVSVLPVMFLLSNCSKTVKIPDANFKAYLLENFDTNKNGRISLSEAQTVQKMDCSNRNIGSLEGIEKFENLEYLDCRNNQLELVDICFNKKLNRLLCTGNEEGMWIHFGYSSPMRNKDFVYAAKPNETNMIIPIDLSKCICDVAVTHFNVFSNY